MPERGKKAFKQIFEYLNSQKNTIFLFSSYCLGQKEEKTTRKNVGLSETQIWTEKPNHFHTKKGFSDIFLKIFSLYLIEHTRYTYRLWSFNGRSGKMVKTIWLEVDKWCHFWFFLKSWFSGIRGWKNKWVKRVLICWLLGLMGKSLEKCGDVWLQKSWESKWT